MNYYNCDHITWKASLSLMKNDPNGQRVYSNLYQMTRDVLMLSLTISAATSLILLTIGLIKIVINHFTDVVPILDSIPIAILFCTLCPAIFLVPLAWVLSYFGCYKNIKNIYSLMQHFIASFSDAERIEIINPAAYVIYYRGHEFIAHFQENPTARLCVGKGKIVLLLPYLDPKNDRTIEMLVEETEDYLVGKNYVPTGINEECIANHFPAHPLPPAHIVTGTADTMVYLMERFDLQSPRKEEVKKGGE